ncbi:MAG: hypothetical protein R3D68_15015 [Hyphomicrobiaceae bacterium]
MRTKLREWFWRYVPLEIAATAFALLGGLGASILTDNGAVIAYAATWAENAGFYGVAFVRELRSAGHAKRAAPASRWSVLHAAAHRLAAEFGPAEVLDSFVLRPALLYLLPKLTGNLTLGLLVGKILADVGFFGMAIIAYEWRKARR